jgi:hypothetical protein
MYDVLRHKMWQGTIPQVPKHLLRVFKQKLRDIVCFVVIAVVILKMQIFEQNINET